MEKQKKTKGAEAKKAKKKNKTKQKKKKDKKNGGQKRNNFVFFPVSSFVVSWSHGGRG